MTTVDMRNRKTSYGDHSRKNTQDNFRKRSVCQQSKRDEKQYHQQPHQQKGCHTDPSVVINAH